MHKCPAQGHRGVFGIRLHLFPKYRASISRTRAWPSFRHEHGPPKPGEISRGQPHLSPAELPTPRTQSCPSACIPRDPFLGCGGPISMTWSKTDGEPCLPVGCGYSLWQEINPHPRLQRCPHPNTAFEIPGSPSLAETAHHKVEWAGPWDPELPSCRLPQHSPSGPGTGPHSWPSRQLLPLLSSSRLPCDSSSQLMLLQGCRSLNHCSEQRGSRQSGMLRELLGPNGLLLPIQPLGATPEAGSQAPVPPRRVLGWFQPPHFSWGAGVVSQNPHGAR